MITCKVVDDRQEKGWDISFSVMPRIGETIQIENFNRKINEIYHVADGPMAGKIVIRVSIG